jgi:hypothetical protein
MIKGITSIDLRMCFYPMILKPLAALCPAPLEDYRISNFLLYSIFRVN